MTTVRIERGERRVTVEIKGHANYKPHKEDHDLVCAAASMLATTLAQHVQKLIAAHVIETVYAFEYQTECVYADFLIKDNPACVVMGTTMVEVIKTGFERLIELYPKNVKFVA